MDAAVPKIFPLVICRFSTILLKDFLREGLDIMTFEVDNPARLKVLLGAMQVIVLSPISSDRVANGVCMKPGKQDRNVSHRRE
jgi:hypothetical protein